MRTYLILVLVGAACLCVIAAGEALRGSDARLLAAREATSDAHRAAEAELAALEESYTAALRGNIAEQRRLEALLADSREEAVLARKASDLLMERLRASDERAAIASLSRDTLQAELLAANDRLEKAYKDIVEIEKQLVELRRNNPAAAEPYRLGGCGGDVQAEPKIDGVVLGVSDRINLILISVGSKDKVQVGYKFTVYRGKSYVSKLEVDKVEDSWSSCRELTDFRKDAIQQGDNVSTRVFD